MCACISIFLFSNNICILNSHKFIYLLKINLLRNVRKINLKTDFKIDFKNSFKVNFKINHVLILS